MAQTALRLGSGLALALAVAACAGPKPQAASPSAAEAVPLPPPPWRDRTHAPLAAGYLQWTDASRDRAVVAQWKAPADAPASALVLILPGLAQGSTAPASLVEALATAGFAVVTIGHPGNDASVWQGSDARRADFTQAARRMYAAGELAERSADVRFVLDSLDRQPPAWLRAGATRRVGVVGIGLGAQTAQALVGESMSRSQAPAVEPRVVAAALLGPYVGFEGPAMHQRYDRVVAPLLVAYGMAEADPYGLGMTSQQRRAMVAELRNARVVELRLPTASSIGTIAPDAGRPMGAAAPPPPESTMPRGDPNRGGRDPRGGPPPAGGSSAVGAPRTAAGPDIAMGLPVTPAGSANERASRVALLFSVVAFFETELTANSDAREWLEGPHPGPAQWTIYPAGRGPAPVGAR
jgi:alpha-beta hydrolase superfamily lysophospholipase